MITCLQNNGEQFDSATRLQTLLVSRSVADHRTVNANVVGSIPTLPAILYGCGILVVQHSPKVPYESSILSVRANLFCQKTQSLSGRSICVSNLESRFFKI